MLSADFIKQCIEFARDYNPAPDEDEGSEEAPISLTTTTTSGFSSLVFGNGAPSGDTSYTPAPDQHAVSREEALSYYAGLPSEPTLVYRTGEKWSPPKGPEAQRRRKELCEVFNHWIVNVWNDGLGLEVDNVMRSHKIPITTIDVVRFKMVEADEPSDEEDVDEETVETEAKKPIVSPVTIWIGVFPETTTATAAHKAAQDVLALLKRHEITDVDVDFRESIYMRKVGPRLHRHVGDLDPLVHVISPLTPALGLPISTKARPNAQGTMALYLAEGGDSDRLLGLTCRHVLIGPNVANLDYAHRQGVPRRSVLLLGKKACTKLADSIKLEIGGHGIAIERWREQVEEFEEREKGTNPDDVEEARKDRLETQALLEKAEKAIEALRELFCQVENYWSKLDNRILGTVLCSPAINLGVGEHHFTEDWGIFQVDRAKLGDGFQGNKIDLGTKLTPQEFTIKCYPRGDDNWRFKYPRDRLLPLRGTIADKLMRNPDMKGKDGEPCLLVVKNGNASGTTLGRANGVFSIVREYFSGNMSISTTSMEWAIINYDSKSEGFSDPGDSGSIIADIRGRIGGMLTGGAGKTKTSDMTYATPFWWLLEQIHAKGFPEAHLNVVK